MSWLDDNPDPLDGISGAEWTDEDIELHVRWAQERAAARCFYYDEFPEDGPCSYTSPPDPLAEYLAPIKNVLFEIGVFHPKTCDLSRAQFLANRLREARTSLSRTIKELEQADPRTSVSDTLWYAKSLVLEVSEILESARSSWQRRDEAERAGWEQAWEQAEAERRQTDEWAERAREGCRNTRDYLRNGPVITYGGVGAGREGARP
jgi:hypothetical protein